jgi:hypothetical protein
VTGYRFLFDCNVTKIASMFPVKRRLALSDLQLPNDASDAQIVEAAQGRRLIIVTANGDDFIREILKFQRLKDREVCRELSGLVVLPGHYETQKQAVGRAEGRLRWGGRKIGWFDVWDKNLCVRLTTQGAPSITRFPVCFYCEKNEAKLRLK